MLARERPAVGRSLHWNPTPTAFFARCANRPLGGPPRYEEHPTAHLVACSDIWFKCYTCLLQGYLYLLYSDIVVWQGPRSDAFRVPIRNERRLSLGSCVRRHVIMR
jgi:hypothetical protein